MVTTQKLDQNLNTVFDKTRERVIFPPQNGPFPSFYGKISLLLNDKGFFVGLASFRNHCYEHSGLNHAYFPYKSIPRKCKGL